MKHIPITKTAPGPNQTIIRFRRHVIDEVAGLKEWRLSYPATVISAYDGGKVERPKG